MARRTASAMAVCRSNVPLSALLTLLAWTALSACTASLPVSAALQSQEVESRGSRRRDRRRHDMSAPKCEALAESFIEAHSFMPKPSADSLLNMIYFLHIPRTAGRTYHACFLKLAHPPSKRCAKSYDVLRLNLSVPACGLLSSHDDMSVLGHLVNNTGVVTQVRDPVDRVLSAYEFAVEVAARTLGRKKDFKMDPAKINTRNVWPWSALVPLMEADLLARAAKVKELGEEQISHPGVEGLPPLDPYSNTLAMSLVDFVNHPAALDVLHNGAAFQVLGLTDYSVWPEAKAVRHCAQQHSSVRRMLSVLAKQHLRGMLHVGVMEQLDDSITSLAATLGLNLTGPSWRGPHTAAFSYEEMKPVVNQAEVGALEEHIRSTSTLLEAKRRLLEVVEGGPEAVSTAAEAAVGLAAASEPAAAAAGNRDKRLEEPAWVLALENEVYALEDDAAALKERLRVASITSFPRGQIRQIKSDDDFLAALDLRRAFAQCSAGARHNSARRKEVSLKSLKAADGRHLAFSRAAREALDPNTVLRIRELNDMDLELHQLARELLQRRLAEQAAAGALQLLRPPETPQRWHPPQRHVRRRERMPEKPLEPQPVSQVAAVGTGAHVGATQPGALQALGL